MPGTRAAAACALTEALNILDLEDYDGETVRLDRAGEMTGFRYLGHGSYRVVLLSDDGVVYKVCHRPHRDPANRREYAFFRKHFGRSWSPSVSLYKVRDRYVLAMPLFEGSNPALKGTPAEQKFRDALACLRSFLKGLPPADGFTEGLSNPDLHEGNWLVTHDGRFVVIDGGGS